MSSEPPDPCADAVAFETIAAEAEAASTAVTDAERLRELATALEVAAECQRSVAVEARRGRLLAAMGESLFARDPDSARALFHASFEVLAAVAEQLDDPAAAAEAARQQYDLYVRSAYFEPPDPLAPTQQACPVESHGSCPYSTAHPPVPYEQDALDELRALDVYARFGDDPERLRTTRYMRFWMLGRHEDLGRELAAVEAFVNEHDGHPLSAWAAFLLLDELSMRAFEREGRSTADLEALAVWLERLPTMKLWELDAAEDLRPRVPTLDAAVGWKLAEAAREREDFDACADEFMGVYNRHRDHDLADALLANAADCLDAADRGDEAAKLRAELRKRYPDSDYAKQSN